MGLYVIAGVNGAGKSSIAGAVLLRRGIPYFNPDEVARELCEADPALPLAEAQSIAWREGVALLEEAIRDRANFALETTLGARTITNLLAQAAAGGQEVRIWYVGLETVELHIARVRARVARGGHDIPEDKIRERFARSHLNLARLAPALTELRVYDNSAERDLAAGERVAPRLLLHARRGAVVIAVSPERAPAWARPVLRAVGADPVG